VINNSSNELSRRINEFFDEEFYLNKYPDVTNFNGTPLEHYIKYGWIELRKPNAWYSDAMVPNDLLTLHTGTPSFVIFLTHLPKIDEKEFHRLCKAGVTTEIGHENCWECSVMQGHFSGRYYRKMNSDMPRSTDALAHFCESGWKEGRNPSPGFDVKYYLNVNRDVDEAKINPYVHYLSKGKSEGRKPKPFDSARYDLLRSLRCMNDLAQDYKKINPKILLIEKNQLFIQILALKKALVVAISHDDYLSQTGGIQRFIHDECVSANEGGYAYLHLSPTLPNIKWVGGDESTLLVNCSLNGDFIGTLTAEEVVMCLRALKSKKTDALKVGVVHSAMGWNLAALQAIFDADFAHRLFYSHDFHALCPEYRLLRNNLHPCDAPSPSSSSCSICAHGTDRVQHLEIYHELFKSINFKLIHPSKMVHDIFLKNTKKYHQKSLILPHIKVEQKSSLKNQIISRDGKKIRIAFCGHPVLQKGFAHFKEIVNNCAELNNIEFLHLGMQNQSMEQVKFIEVTLKNGASQMVRELKNNNVNLVFIGSIWRETFGYIAYEAAQAGAAIITFENSGNVAAFVKEFNIGAVVKNTNEFYQKLLESDFEEKLNEWLGNVNNLIFKNNKSFMSKGVLE
jgi:hypothetical protein